MPIKLTKDQQVTFESVKKFLADKDESAMVIKGSAGTGKTTLTKHIADYIMDSGKLMIIAVAPTHKARRVLHRMLNIDRFMPIPSVTVASILGKMRDHSYIGTHRYTNGSTQKMDNYDCFILDEVSMVSDKDLSKIEEYILEHDKKIIMIGDDCQIPSPSQQLIQKDRFCYRPNSNAFDILNMCHLTEIVRQASKSIIVSIASYIRDNITKDIDLRDIITSLNLVKSSPMTKGSSYPRFLRI